ncbi:serine protease [Streptomyces sp. JJ36]|uniref:S1 family peptidase n=1 Tax=Streptomyces sp. JJ36 TaxID=2736645 RepID=UPI001F32717F|nr:serine protease [Streptomyces sp. JJ36]MCF6522035.1 trypsin-like peptidase domain-containing protein [Streptomyces sp. JJ36]
MKRPLVGALAAALLGATAATGLAATPALAAPHDTPTGSTTGATGTVSTTGTGFHRADAPAPAVDAAPEARDGLRAPDFAGTVALSNCSGSLVRVPQSEPTDPALVLSNGHCLESGMPGPGEVVVDQPSSRRFTLLDARANDVATLRATKVAYGTMTRTDVSLYELNSTYAQIESRYGIEALDIAPEHPSAGTDITVVSGYWKRTYSCRIDTFVYELREAGWSFSDSIRYTPECDTIGGTSGSPIVNDATGEVIGVNNTGNTDGGRCTLNNPCEVDENGDVTVHEGINYGQQTYLLTDCIGTGNKLDLGLPECELPRP